MGHHKAVANDKLTYRIIGVVIDVHRQLGSNLSEQMYQEALVLGLEKEGLKAEPEKEVPVVYQGEHLGTRFVDLLVEDEVVLELKVVGRLTDEHFQQLGSNVQFLEKRRGLLINFGAARATIRRYANDHRAA